MRPACDPSAVRIVTSRHYSPAGAAQHSPALQRWASLISRASPVGTALAEDKFQIVRHAILLQKCNKFLIERCLAMMFLLLLDVANGHVNLRGVDAEGAVTFR